MADFDDGQDKARRNLVTLSTLILGSVYLKPKLAAKGQLFGFIDTSEVEPHKMWVAVIFLLCYFAYRYWYSQARRDAASEWAKYRRTLAEEWIAQRVASHAKRFYVNKTPSSLVNDLGKEKIGDGSGKGLIKVTAHLSDGEHLPPNSVFIIWGFKVKSPNDQMAYTHNFVGWPRRMLDAAVFIRACVVSDGTHELIVPFALAALALVACVTGAFPGLLPWSF